MIRNDIIISYLQVCYRGLKVNPYVSSSREEHLPYIDRNSFTFGSLKQRSKNLFNFYTIKNILTTYFEIIFLIFN